MDKQQRVRVMTVDDHELMRGGIRFTVLAFDDIELVGEAHTGQEALRVCDDVSPDVVLMDMKMSGMDGIATTKAIKAQHADVQIVMLTSFHDRQLVQQAFQAGAVGYVLKDTSKDELADAIRAAHAGRTTLSSDVANDLADAVPLSLGHDLSERERDILALLAQGLSNKQIAKQLTCLSKVHGSFYRLSKDLDFGISTPMTGASDKYWSVSQCVENVRVLKSRHPKLRGGYLWESGREGVQEWAAHVGPLLLR